MKKQTQILPNAMLLGEVSSLLLEGRSVVLMTKGNSMLPFIRGGKDSVELLRRIPFKVGDIALARLPDGRFVLHRIIELSDTVILKGDGNLDSTESCSPDDLSGVVVRIVRPDGRSTDCTTARFAEKSRFWREAPRFVRRYFLAIYRRLI